MHAAVHDQPHRAPNLIRQPGPLPLDLLDREVTAWIETRKERRLKHIGWTALSNLDACRAFSFGRTCIVPPVPRLPRAQPVLALLALIGLASTLSAQNSNYPAARSGGNYMHNYYLPPAGSSTPWWPSWSPDGQWLAFAMHGSLWRMRVANGTSDGIAEEIAHG